MAWYENPLYTQTASKCEACRLLTVRGAEMAQPTFRIHFWCYPCDRDWTIESSEVREAVCPNCSRNCSPMYTDDLHGEPATADAEAWFLNYYHCYRCHYEWTDEWSATCDDECPECHARGCSPFRSDDLSGATHP